MDTLVLACTHFPLLGEELAALFGPDVALIDGAQGIARRIAALTEGQPFARAEPDLAVTTGPLEEFALLTPRLHAAGLERIEGHALATGRTLWTTGGLASLISQSPWLLSLTRWGGVLFLLVYGILALQRALRPQGLDPSSAAPRSRRAVLLAALAVTLLNPHVYLDTVLLIGSLGAQQAVPGAYAAGAASASALWFFGIALGAAWLAPWLARPATWRILEILVAGMMFSVAWQLIHW